MNLLTNIEQISNKIKLLKIFEETKLNQQMTREHSLFNHYTNENRVKGELPAYMLTLYQ